MSQLCSAPLPEMLPDDISPAVLWEALESNPAALRAARAAETHTQQPQELCLCLKIPVTEAAGRNEHLLERPV